MRKNNGDLNYKLVIPLALFFFTLFLEVILLSDAKNINDNTYTDIVENEFHIIADLNKKQIEYYLDEISEEIILYKTLENFKPFLHNKLNNKSKEEMMWRFDKYIEISRDFELGLLFDKDYNIVLSSEPILEGEINKGVLKYTKKNQIKFTDVFYSEFFKKNIIVAYTDLYDENNDRIGTFGFALKMNKIANVMNSDYLGKSGESILINDQNILLSPSKFIKGDNKGVLTQKVDTYNANECIAHKLDISEGGHYHSDGSWHKFEGGRGSTHITSNYIDYRGEETFGSHIYIEKSDWCVLVKKDVSEIERETKELFFKNHLVLPLALLIFILFFGFYIGWFIDKEKKYFKR